MKNLVLRYGFYATLIAVGIQILFYFIGDFKNPENFELGEMLGYSTILLSMIFVFLGIKKHRDENLGGSISFSEALKVGLLIVIIPSLAFGLYNWFYVEVLDPGFVDNYFNYQLEKMQAAMSPSEFEIKKAEMEAQKDMFQNPLLGSGVMFMTVFLIGVIVSLVSSIVLKKNRNANEGVVESNA